MVLIIEAEDAVVFGQLQTANVAPLNDLSMWTCGNQINPEFFPIYPGVPCFACWGNDIRGADIHTNLGFCGVPEQTMMYPAQVIQLNDSSYSCALQCCLTPLIESHPPISEYQDLDFSGLQNKLDDQSCIQAPLRTAHSPQKQTESMSNSSGGQKSRRQRQSRLRRCQIKGCHKRYMQSDSLHKHLKNKHGLPIGKGRWARTWMSRPENQGHILAASQWCE